MQGQGVALDDIDGLGDALIGLETHHIVLLVDDGLAPSQADAGIELVTPADGLVEGHGQLGAVLAQGATCPCITKLITHAVDDVLDIGSRAVLGVDNRRGSHLFLGVEHAVIHDETLSGACVAHSLSLGLVVDDVALGVTRGFLDRRGGVGVKDVLH